MVKMKRKTQKHQTKKILNLIMHYTLQGVPQFRIKLHCGTPFLMVRNLSDYRLNSGFVFADI